MGEPGLFLAIVGFIGGFLGLIAICNWAPKNQANKHRQIEPKARRENIRRMITGK